MDRPIPCPRTFITSGYQATTSHHLHNLLTVLLVHVHHIQLDRLVEARLSQRTLGVTHSGELSVCLELGLLRGGREWEPFILHQAVGSALGETRDDLDQRGQTDDKPLSHARASAWSLCGSRAAQIA